MHTRGISDLRLNNFVVRLFVYRREIHLKATSLRVHVQSQRSFLPWISELSTAVQRFQYDVQQNISCSDGGRRFFDTHAVVRLFEENGPGFIPLRSFTILPLRFIYFFIFLKSCWLLFFPREIFPPRFHHSAGRGAGQDPGADDQLQHGSHLQRHGDQGAAGEQDSLSVRWAENCKPASLIGLCKGRPARIRFLLLRPGGATSPMLFTYSECFDVISDEAAIHC